MSALQETLQKTANDKQKVVDDRTAKWLGEGTKVADARKDANETHQHARAELDRYNALRTAVETKLRQGVQAPEAE